MIIAESLSVGLPTIVTNEPPMNEFSSPYCQTIKVQKRYARADGYYWPQSIASVEDLVEKMSTYLNDLDFHLLKDKVRNFALQNFSWQENSRCLGELLMTCESLPSNKDSEVVAHQIDFYKLPYFEKLRPIYYFVYDIHRLIKKLKGRK